MWTDVPFWGQNNCFHNLIPHTLHSGRRIETPSIGKRLKDQRGVERRGCVAPSGTIFQSQYKPIKLQEYAIPFSTPPTTPLSQKIRVNFLMYFSKHDQLDLLKASNSISDHLTSIFLTISRPDVPAWAPKGREAKDDVKRPEGPPDRSQAPEGT